MNAGIYARLSVLKASEQATEAAMERQEDDCRALCARRGWKVVKVYPDEGVSAFQKGRKRPAFERAVADLEAGRIDVLVCWKLDRLVRRLKDWVRIEEAVERSGGLLVSAQEGEQAQLTLRFLASIAEQESNNTSTRVRRQQEQAAARGGPPLGGRRLLGYGPRRETIIEKEAEFVREAARLLLAGRSLRSVVAWANTTGVTSTTGRQWSLQTLRGTLLSPGLAGRRVYRGVDFADGRWEPILDRATHEMLVAILNDPAKRTRGPGVKHLLSGLVVCGRDGCGAPLMTHYARPGRREYWCQANKGLGRPGCGRTVVAAEPLEQTITAMVLKRLAGPGLAKALAAEDDDPGAAAELKAAETRRDEIEHLYNSGQIRQDAFLRMHGPAVERVDRARARLRAQASQSVLAELPKTKAELERWWNDPTRTIEERRAVIQAVVERIVVGPSLRPSRTFNSDRIRPPYGPQWRDAK